MVAKSRTGERLLTVQKVQTTRLSPHKQRLLYTFIACVVFAFVHCLYAFAYYRYPGFCIMTFLVILATS